MLEQQRPEALPRVMFYVQHLLGIGHLVRAARIAKAFADRGCVVELVMGGAGTPPFDVGSAAIVRLPPVRAADGGFSALVHEDGAPFDDDAQAARAKLLRDHFDRFAPDVLIIEAFPFGRSQMAFELVPLLEHARVRPVPPLIATSIRDILQGNRRPKRIAETIDRIARFFDLVLVHGDPRLVRLEETFPQADCFAAKIAYTGFVAPDRAARPDRIDDGPAVIVSAGGGAVGEALLEAALRARPHTRLAGRPWLVLTGPNMPAAARDRLRALAAPGVTLAPFVPDLAKHLQSATVSISQAGYNTVADILVAGCRAVLVPYAAGGEDEQTMRAMLLGRLGLATGVAESELTPSALARAVDAALDGPPPSETALDLDGARTTVSLVLDRVAARKAV